MVSEVIGGRFKFYLMSILGFYFLSSCSISKKEKIAEVEKMPAEEVLVSYNNNLNSPEYISANLRIKLENKDKKSSFSAKLRMQKDNKIWINISFLGISMARVIITPDSLVMYERQNNTYFKGDFSLLSHLLGTELDYYKLQSILLGKNILEINADKYKTLVSDRTYLLEYENNRKLTKKGINTGDMIKRFWITPDKFQLRRQLIAFPDRSNTLIVSNDSFVELDNGYKLPEKINVQVIGDLVTIVDLNFTDIKTDSIKSFPFRIPEGYKKMRIR